MYIHVLRRICDAVGRKRPEEWRTNSRFLLHHNAPAHRSVLFRVFLAKNKVTTLEHPLYARYLVSADIYLFPRLKSYSKGRCFCDATDITKNVMEEIKRLSQNGFQENDKHLQYTAEQAEYFEGNVS